MQVTVTHAKQDLYGMDFCYATKLILYNIHG